MTLSINLQERLEISDFARRDLPNCSVAKELGKYSKKGLADLDGVKRKRPPHLDDPRGGLLLKTITSL